MSNTNNCESTSSYGIRCELLPGHYGEHSAYGGGLLWMDGEPEQGPGLLGDITIRSETLGFAGLPELAKRLGVEPGIRPYGFGFVGDDGEYYDVFAMMHAMLDRLEAMEGGEG